MICEPLIIRLILAIFVIMTLHFIVKMAKKDVDSEEFIKSIGAKIKKNSQIKNIQIKK